MCAVKKQGRLSAFGVHFSVKHRIGVNGRIVDDDQLVFCRAVVSDMRDAAIGHPVMHDEIVGTRTAMAMVPRTKEQRIISAAAIQEIRGGLVGFAVKSGQPVIPGIAVQSVGTRASGKPIIAIATGQPVIAGAAVKVVCPGAAKQRVSPFAPGQQVSAEMAGKLVVPVSTEKVVIAVLSDKGILTGTARRHIIAAASPDNVIACPRVDRVIAIAAVDQVVAIQPVDLVICMVPGQHIVCVGARNGSAFGHRILKVIGMDDPVLQDRIGILQQGPGIRIGLILRFGLRIILFASVVLDRKNSVRGHPGEHKTQKSKK